MLSLLRSSSQVSCPVLWSRYRDFLGFYRMKVVTPIWAFFRDNGLGSATRNRVARSGSFQSGGKCRADMSPADSFTGISKSDRFGSTKTSAVLTPYKRRLFGARPGSGRPAHLDRQFNMGGLRSGKVALENLRRSRPLPLSRVHFFQGSEVVPATSDRRLPSARGRSNSRAIACAQIALTCCTLVQEVTGSSMSDGESRNDARTLGTHVK